MSNEYATAEAANDDLAKALQIIAEKTPDRKCPFCDGTNWTYEKDNAGQGDTPKIAVIPLKSYRAYDPAIIPTISLTCSNCGFIRLHNVLNVLNSAAQGNEPAKLTEYDWGTKSGKEIW